MGMLRHSALMSLQKEQRVFALLSMVALAAMVMIYISLELLITGTFKLYLLLTVVGTVPYIAGFYGVRKYSMYLTSSFSRYSAQILASLFMFLHNNCYCIWCCSHGD